MNRISFGGLSYLIPMRKYTQKEIWTYKTFSKFNDFTLKSSIYHISRYDSIDFFSSQLWRTSGPKKLPSDVRPASGRRSAGVRPVFTKKKMFVSYLFFPQWSADEVQWTLHGPPYHSDFDGRISSIKAEISTNTIFT